MKTELLGPYAVASRSKSRGGVSSRPGSAQITYATATSADAPALHALIQAHLEEGRLLPREMSELHTHAHRFVVAVRRGRIVGCAELAPLSAVVAEVRSLVVDRRARSLGIGRRLVAELTRRAQSEGFEQLCAFAHDAAYFVRLGFCIVPHTRIPEKIARDCCSCPQFRHCGQHGLLLELTDARRPGTNTSVPLPWVRG